MDHNMGTIAVFIDVVIVLVLFCITLRIFLKPSKRLPPGPIGLPFLGYLPFLTKKPYEKLSELRRRYGKVFGLYLGQEYVVVLGDPVVVREAFSRPEFSGRPNRTALSPDERRISMSITSGPPWSEQRRFILHSMRDLGMGKSRMEEHIKDELAYLIKAIRAFKDEVMDVKPLLASCTNNIILAFAAGRRLDYSDKVRKTQNDDFETMTNFMGQTSVQGYIESAMKIPGVKKIFGYENYRKAFDTTMEFIREEIRRHKENLNENEVNDLLSDYILEVKKQRGNPSSSFTEHMMEGNMMMFFLAGSETVRTTIDWALYAMATFPAIQSKVQKEIDDIIGFERWPNWLDHKEMFYTQAVLTEVLRWRPAVPIDLQRCTLADTSVCGYNIPKGTTILANLWDVHHNPIYWENPEEFDPSRFLCADSKTMKKTNNYMPFSYGKRSCPGQSLAVVEVFLFVTAILQRFNISLPEGFKPDLEGVTAIVNQPRPHKMRFTNRQGCKDY